MIKTWRHEKSEYVDLDTAEVITEQEAKTYYIIIKTQKHVTIRTELDKNYNRIKIGYIRHTFECKRSPQGRLFK